MVDRPPSGHQYELRHGDHVAVVVEVGATLRHYSVGDRPVLDGFAADERISGGRGQLLVPWPNRIRDGRYQWAGEEHQLTLSEPEAGNAIHGLLRWTPWSLLEREEARVLLGTTLPPQPGYPFLLDVTAEYAVGPDGLTVRVSSTNAGDEEAPYGVGQHPYLTVGTERVDPLVLTVPAGQWIRVDERGTPVATEAVAGSAYDFRTPRAIGDQRLDTAYGELERDHAGRTVVRMSAPAGDRGVDLWLGEGAGFVQVYTGDTLPDGGRRRRGVAVEPMSCPPDAFRSGVGVVGLPPGGQHTLRWGITPW